MNRHLQLNSSSTIAITGIACRLPGSSDLRALDGLLAEGRCAVMEVPAGRWAASRFLHGPAAEKGMSCSFSGGYLDAPFAFDPAVFGLSRREAEQMDPQQRLLLEVAWEALEDAGIPAGRLSGSATGVYVGASGLDHASTFTGDPAAIDRSFMTGNTLSIISNRLSYCFDLHGPSLTVDTACSSSLVALSLAVSDLRSGRVDLAIVGGVNLLLSPIPFIGFTQAAMISPTGLCRPFSADADGYVRAEGAAAVVLSRAADAVCGATRALLLDVQVNSDGRTTGVSLPALTGQVALLERTYGGLDLAPDQIAFIEAHGTGTRVGDPIEAEALARVLGRRRSACLPIGSIKSNIGHLEPASGLAGLIKAVRALETRLLPATLHLDAARPTMNFEEMGLSPAREPVHLQAAGPIYAGVSSFGFGGTNAHAVLQSAPQADPASQQATAPRLVLGAADPEALKALAGLYAERLRDGAAAGRLAAAAASQRSLLPHRAVIDIGSLSDDDLQKELSSFAVTGKSLRVATGEARSRSARLCFVYPGNGLQWPGMGRAAYDRNEAFRAAFDEISDEFAAIAGWSLTAALTDPDLAARLQSGAVAQPMIFAVQAALTRSLAAEGLVPSLVLGHSLGEIAASHVAGALTLPDALRVIHERSTVQERVHGEGSMAVAAASRDAIAAMGLAIDIAAENGPRSTTVSGSNEDMKAFTAEARARRIATRTLPLSYPFHSRLLDRLEAELLQRLSNIRPRTEALCMMMSSVTAAPIEPLALDASYWWRNLRETVQFQQAVRQAAAQHADVFVEVGSRPVLLQPLKEALAESGRGMPVLASLGESDSRHPADPVRGTAARIVAHGGGVGAEPCSAIDRSLGLPTYPWQHREFRAGSTSERIDLFGDGEEHPLLGSRLTADSWEWRRVIDVSRLAHLADHQIEGEIVVPGAALLDMALCAARQIIGVGALQLLDVDLVSPLALHGTRMREVRFVHDHPSSRFRIESRSRFESGAWSLHARGQLGIAPLSWDVMPALGGNAAETSVDTIYETARRAGFHYGPGFRRLARHRRAGSAIEVELLLPAVGAAPAAMLDPANLDSVFHAIFGALKDDAQVNRLYMPVRFGRVKLWTDHAVIATAGLQLEHDSGDVSIWRIELRDQAGCIVGGIADAVFRSMPRLGGMGIAKLFIAEQWPVTSGRAIASLGPLISPRIAQEGWLLLRAYFRYAVHDLLRGMSGKDRRIVMAPVSGAAQQVGPSLLPILLEELASAGLGRHEAGGFRLAASGRVKPNAILRSFIAENPLASADLMSVLAWLDDLPRRLESGLSDALPVALRRRLLRGTLCLSGLRDELSAALAAALPRAGKSVARILVLAEDAEMVLEPLLVWGRSGAACLGICGRDAEQRARIMELLPEDVAAVEVAIDAEPGLLTLRWDVLVVPALQPVTPSWQATLSAAASHLQEQGMVISAVPAHDALFNLLLDMLPPDLAGVTHALTAAGLTLERRATGEHVISARPGIRHRESHEAEGGVAEEPLFRCDMTRTLEDLLLDLRRNIIAADARSSQRLWCLCATEDDAMAMAIAAFLRVASCEYPKLDLRFIRCGSTPPDAHELAALFNTACRGAEELDLRTEATLSRLRRLSMPRPALRLDAGRIASRPIWDGCTPPEAGAGEISVRVEAIGLNFRDVMLTSGLLPADLFAGGLAGASIGFEFAGIVTGCGEDVAGLSPGSRVFGVAPRAFATHVVARACDVMAVPDGMEPEVAAALPVAFLTAWYGLVELARLQPGERVLIHGAAGGVGLAAVQIARLRGARVIATASTPAKRALARAHGADATFDSRSLAFGSEIRRRYGGVEIVVNSLAGDAMEESLRLLVPFGRFIELGKRDYAENRSLGLRPLRENIGYFGVDLDQVLRHRPEIVKRGLTFILEQVRKGRLTPLPVMAFAADEAGLAFDSMKKASHAGKIVVRPPSVHGNGEAFAIGPDEVILVIGGTRGFGLETALWMAEQGARRIVVAGRSGDIDPVKVRRVEALRERGVAFAVEAVDVADAAAVKDLVVRVQVKFGPITGVVHSALHLEDGLMSALDGAALSRVLAPKVKGARHLLQAVVGAPLRFFVLYSSVAAVTGNPGQAAYAAANGYLDGLSAMARQAGVPCLSVAWGPILDVGVLARQSASGAAAARALNSVATPVREALAALGGLLSQLYALPPAVTYGDLGGLAALAPGGMRRTGRLALVIRAQDAAGVAPPRDLLKSLADMSDAQALGLIREVVVAELARILRTPQATIDLQRPLDQLGLDSLMIMEFKMAFEARFGIELPSLSISVFRNPEDMARRILQQLRGEQPAAHARLTPEEHRLLAVHRAASPAGDEAERTA